MVQLYLENGGVVDIQQKECAQINYRVAEVNVPEGKQVVGYEQPGFQGRSVVWSHGKKAVQMPKQGFSMKSFRVIPAGADNREETAFWDTVENWWPASMKSHDERMGWFREARFGMFIHWGVYSAFGGVYHGQRVGYGEHLMRACTIGLKEYQEKIVKTFDPYAFDAGELVKLAKEAGMKYLVITAKHHDGFAMYESDAYPYDIRMTKCRIDPMRALKDACDKAGIKFGFYYSHAFDWEHPDAPGNDWDYENPGGDRRLFEEEGKLWFHCVPELIERTAREYVDKKAIPQIQELIKKYKPDILWFDTPHKLPPSENMRILKAIRELDGNIVVNSRIINYPDKGFREFADYLNTADRGAEIYPTTGDWEVIPTTNESYGYSVWDKSHKKPEHFIRLLAKSASRGGNVLMNIGPKGSGAVDEIDVKILKRIGAWMRVNGESIYGCTRSGLAAQPWGDISRKGNRLYLHIYHKPSDHKLLLPGVGNQLLRVYPLANPQTALSYQRIDYYNWEIDLTAAGEDSADLVVCVEFAGTPDFAAYAALGTVDENLLRSFDAQATAGMEYGSGKRNEDFIGMWDSVTKRVSWQVYSPASIEYKTVVRYKACKSENVNDQSNLIALHDAGGRYSIATSSGKQERTVRLCEEGAFVFDEFRIVLPAGRSELMVCAEEITGRELMKLYDVTLIAVKAGEEAQKLEFDITDTGE